MYITLKTRRNDILFKCPFNSSDKMKIIEEEGEKNPNRLIPRTDST